MAAPSVWDTITDGIVIVGSLPERPNGSPATLLAITTAIAPATFAFFDFWTKVQPPRSTTAILPATAAVLPASYGLQPGPISPACVTIVAGRPVIPVPVSGGPYAAVPTLYVFGFAVLRIASALPGVRTFGASEVTKAPCHTRPW